MTPAKKAAQLLALAALVSTAAGGAEPAPHPTALTFEPVSYQPPAARHHRLPSGPSVYLAPDPSLPLVELAVALRAGSFLEPAEQTGLSELTAALLRRGGAGDRTADDLDESLDALGAELDTLGGERRSGLSLSVPSWELPHALDLVFDILARPRFDAERLSVLRENLLESMGRRNQDPLAVLQREWAWLLFGDFYGARHLTPASLDAIDREAIEAFYHAWWRPENLIFAISGDVETESTLTDLENRIDGWRRAIESPAREIPWPPPDPPAGAGAGLYLAVSDSPQDKVLLGHRIEASLDWTARERAAVEVLQEVLGGGGAVSRLSGRLRTATGLVYRVWTNIEPGPGSPGYFRIFFETNPESTARALALAVEEIERLQNDLVHPRELEIVRRTLLNRVPSYFDTPEKTAGRHSENELLGRSADYWSSHLENLDRISREEVRQAARRYLRPDDLRVLVVGRPVGEGARALLEEAAGSGLTLLPIRDPLTLEPIATRR